MMDTIWTLCFKRRSLRFLVLDALKTIFRGAHRLAKTEKVSFAPLLFFESEFYLELDLRFALVYCIFSSKIILLKVTGVHVIYYSLLCILFGLLSVITGTPISFSLSNSEYSLIFLFLI